jgi:hypothetical protein
MTTNVVLTSEEIFSETCWVYEYLHVAKNAVSEGTANAAVLTCALTWKTERCGSSAILSRISQTTWAPFQTIQKERTTDLIDAFQVASFSQAMQVMIFVPAFSLSFKLLLTKFWWNCDVISGLLAVCDYFTSSSEPFVVPETRSIQRD